MGKRLTWISATGAAGLLALTALFATPQSPAQMGPGMMGAGDNLTPPVGGLYNGKEITFIHTEASDAGVAGVLTRMMGPKVLHVPNLARIPAALLGEVYVFTNGVKGAGPMGFQPDVFDSVPGDPRYTPLRALNLVTWRAGVTSRVVGSAQEVKAAGARGQLSIKRPGIVINMPILTWPGGQR